MKHGQHCDVPLLRAQRWGRHFAELVKIMEGDTRNYPRRIDKQTLSSSATIGATAAYDS
jgi:hypothetical protein